MSDRFVKLMATWFHIGLFPLGPGSLASAAGMLIYFLLHQTLWLYVLVLLIITYLGFQVSDRMEEIAGQKDPSCIVIDEVSGVMIAFFLLPLTPSVVITTFFLFRAFDMFKIYPVNQYESMKGGVGVMMDDIIAGIYTNITMQIAVRLAGL
jgi:phosphatidylglycerophosphatase A